MSPTYPYPRPAVTVDVVALREHGARIEVLLIKRGSPPFRGAWALPGGYLDDGEEIEAAARREVREETGVAVAALYELGTFGKVGRDPRSRTLSVCFLAFIEGAKATPDAADDASLALWVPIRDVPTFLAFDHREILDRALREAEDQARRARPLLAWWGQGSTVAECRAALEALLAPTSESQEDMEPTVKSPRARTLLSLHGRRPRAGRRRRGSS